MIERKPSPAPKRSLKSLEAGLALFPHFRSAYFGVRAGDGGAGCSYLRSNRFEGAPDPNIGRAVSGASGCRIACT
jgi:hypothetical protein